MTKDELNKILDEHKIWIESCGEKGSRANLSGAKLIGANLSGAKLIGADLSGADLSGAKLIGADLPDRTWIITGEEYHIQIHGDNVRAGCQCHSVDKWKSCTESDIRNMDGERATKFYHRLLEIIDFYCKDKS